MDLRQRLDRFRAAHAPRTVRHAGTRWRYLVGGGGPATVLVLGGALGIAEFGFPLIEADDDPMITAPGREALRALYPRAARRLFHGTGHLAAILRADEYNAVVAGFLRDAARTAAEGS